MSDEHELLREAIRLIIREEGDVGMPGYGADIGPMGTGYGFMNYGGSLKDVFIKPFMDVVSTTKGVATELTTRAVTAVQVAIQSILSTFIPLYETKYSEIFKQMDKNLGAVRKKYENVYRANEEAFRDKDASFLAFLYDPSAWITSKAVGNSPAAAANVLEVFADASVGAGTHLLEAVRYLKELAMEVRGVSRYHRNVPQRLRRQAKAHSDMLPWEARGRRSPPILEAEKQEMSVPQRVQKILSDPEIRKEIAASKLAQRMRKDAQGILGSLTANLGKDIADVNSIGSIDDVVRLSNGRVKAPNLGGVPPQEKQAAELATVSNVKGGLSEFYRKSLEGAIAAAQDGGVSPDNEYVRTLRGLLGRVGR